MGLLKEGGNGAKYRTVWDGTIGTIGIGIVGDRMKSATLGPKLRRAVEVGRGPEARRVLNVPQQTGAIGRPGRAQNLVAGSVERARADRERQVDLRSPRGRSEALPTRTDRH